MKKSEGDRFKSRINESTLSLAIAVPPSPMGKAAKREYRFSRIVKANTGYVEKKNNDGHSLPRWGRLRNEDTAFLETKPSPRGEGGERSEPDRVLAV